MIALITGASKGIGRATALALASDGYDIAVNYRSSDEAAKALQKEIEAIGRKALLVQGDVGSEVDCRDIVAKTKENLGPIDILVNNAGVTEDGLMVRMSDEQFQRLLDTNLVSAFRMARLVLPDMLKKRQGRIINMSSVAGIYGNAGQVNYSAAKAGIIGLTRSLAKEIGSRRITVNAVAPGLINTDMSKKLDERQIELIKSRVTLGRLGEPEEVAAVVAFLASEKASYITGQVIEVSGGLSM
jgi:3-oxoacyl-[acyl-carrier protein] reductase